MCQLSVNFFKMKAILLESGDQCLTVTQFGGGFELRDLGRKNQIRRIRSEFWNQFQFNSNQDMELAGFLVPWVLVHPGQNQMGGEGRGETTVLQLVLQT
jgi:hypothetical protein